MLEGRDFKKELEEIFLAGVERVDPELMLLNQCKIERGILKFSLPNKKAEYDLGKYNKIIVIGAGKATAKMAKAMESILGEKINEGLISVKYQHTEPLTKIRIIEAGHPVPDKNSVKAATEIYKLAKKADEKTLVINLISGGGSALLCMPYSNEEYSCNLEEKQKTTSLLLECGAGIAEINTIRKHLSGIKGGRLAEAIYPGTAVNVILSDVIGDSLDSIASGPAVPDSTFYTDALRIVNKYNINSKLPKSVQRIINAGVDNKIAETPKKESFVFDKNTNILMGTNLQALKAAELVAKEQGYNTSVLSSQISGEASEIAKFYLGIALDIKRNLGMLDRPACIIAGGETTVTIKGKGKGGRNQEMALSFLAEMGSNKGIYFLSAGTDGNDGPTDAAGAFATEHIFESCKEAGLNIQEYLNKNDSYNFFKKNNGLLITGPTNTNVCDIQILLIP